MARRAVIAVGAAAVAAALGLGAAIAWASLRSGSVLDGLARLAADPWGLVTLLDLSLGLLILAAWAGWTEGWRRAWPWWIGFLCFGNLATALFVAWRCRRARTLGEAVAGR